MCPPTNFEGSDPETFQGPVKIPVGLLPSSEICKAAFELAVTSVTPAVLNHSIRVFRYAKLLAEQTSSSYVEPAKLDLLFTACILHDVGTADVFDGPQRFEVEGADAAVSLLKQYEVNDSDAHDVWIAIAIHSSPGIAERISELARIVRLAVLFDFHREHAFAQGVQSVDLKKLRAGFEEDFPRLSIEKVLGDAVVEQAIRKPAKAPAASWPSNLYRAHLADPAWDGVNKDF